MTFPSVSIGVTTYNRAATVGRAVKSVLMQTYTGPIECVVIDDGSTDNTEEMLGRVRGALKHYHRNDVNRGIAYSKNRALVAGTGELRGILDSDDWYEPTFIERCVTELMETPSLSCVYTDNLIANDKGQHVNDALAAEWSREALLRCGLRGDSWLARWDVLEQTQLHDELFKLEVDYDLFYQLLELQESGRATLKRIPEMLQTVTRHTGRTSNNQQAASYWHAAGLGKYGYAITWAEQRAVAHPRGASAIVDGYAYGQSLAYRRRLKRILRVDDNTPERWAKTWAQDDRRLDPVLLTSVLQWIPERCSVLDLGCGDGSLLQTIATVRPEVLGLGVDYVLPRQPPSARLQWIQCDLRNGMPECQAADVILCTEVIEHLQDPLRVLTIARRLLKPRGHLLLTTPLGDDIKDTYHLWALMPADIAALAAMAGGGRITHMGKTGAYGARAVLYVITWPDR